MNKQEFDSCMKELESFYGGTILNGGIMEATWFGTLKHLSLGQMQIGIGRCFKKHPRQYNFFPSADQILEFAQGEYRPPGENVKQNFSAPSLPSQEARMTPDQIDEKCYRGRLTARIIVACTGYMSPDEKNKLIDQLKDTPTHELERIAETSKRVSRKSGFNNFAHILEQIERNCKNELPNDFVDSRTQSN
jgi:hypothetical protein